MHEAGLIDGWKNKWQLTAKCSGASSQNHIEHTSVTSLMGVFIAMIVFLGTALVVFALEHLWTYVKYTNTQTHVIKISFNK